MPLTLVTGPANASKAGALLGPLRERLAEAPLLVVPTFADVEHSRRELAESGAVFGVQVLRFSALFRLIAERTGYHARVASRLQRDVIAEAAVRDASLRALAASAERPGFARAAVRLAAELERSAVEPARLTQALRQWAGDGPRRVYADEVSDVYRRYRDRLDGAGLVDADLFAWRALAALQRDPGRWGAAPVFAYGFDDFDGLELDALDTLAHRAGVEVMVSLPYEAGREAFRATARVREELVERGARVETLEPRADHYAPQSRPALHALERGLFEAGAAAARSGGAVRVHSAGGERAEVELCGGELLRLLRAGTPPGDVAVVFREPDRYASIVEQVFRSYGIPYSIDRSVALAHTGLGRGLLALQRCAVLDGSAEDLLAYLRTPGLLREPRLADRLEAEVRRAGVDDAAGARRIWEATPKRWPLEEIDRLAAARDMTAFLAELELRLDSLFAGPYRRRAHVLEGPQLDDARAFGAARTALSELRAVGGAGLGHRRIHDALAALPVRVGADPQPDRVQVASPLAIRARRFAAVFVCGLQEREFPRRGAPEPFLPDADRREIARASGLRLPLREDQVERERYLFYVCASRAERLLVLSSRYCDEEGNPEAPSFLLADVRSLLTDAEEHVLVRSLADVAWSLDDAPTRAEWERALAARGARRSPASVGPLAGAEALAELAGRGPLSAAALERFAGCPVQWLVEDVLRPEQLEPDPEQMVRGSYAHKVLELTLRRLGELTGSRRVTAASLGEAERIMVQALAELRGEFRLAPSQTRVRAAVRRLELDLLRYLRHEAERDGLFEPEHLELRFGFDGDGHEAVELDDGLRVRGVIDRVDTWNGWALVRDYKSGRADSYKLADWERRNRFQAALYMLVVERLLGLRPAGAVYVPLGGSDRRSRGLVAGELAEELGSDFVDNDRQPAGRFAEHTSWARSAIARIAQRMRSGDLESCPDTCAYRGGCSHPSICRIDA